MAAPRVRVQHLERIYHVTNRMFGREYRRDDPFLAVFEVVLLLGEDAERVPCHPNEIMFLEGGGSLTWGQFCRLPYDRRHELLHRFGAATVRPTWMSCIEALTPGLLRIWRVHAELPRALRERSRAEGLSREHLKRLAIATGLLLVAEDSKRLQDVRLGSQGAWQRDVVPRKDLSIVDFMRWFKGRTLSAAEATIFQEDWPRKGRQERSDIYDRGQRADGRRGAESEEEDYLERILVDGTLLIDERLAS